MDLPRRIRAVLALDPEAPAVEFEGVWHRWGEIAAAGDALDARLASAGIGEGGAVGLVLRNRPAQLAALVAMLATRRCAVVVSPLAGDRRLSEELRASALPAVVADARDFSREGVAEACAAAGSLGIELTGDPARPCRPAAGLAARGPGRERPARPGLALEMVTSGTTGPPKRIPVHTAQLEAALANATRLRPERRRAGPALSGAVAILYLPLVHISGVWGLLTSLVEGRRICLLERFSVEAWRDAVVRHRPAAAGLVPAALRMVLEADLPREDLVSLRAVVAGTAPLPPETAAAFEARYGIPVLATYGATEFAGGVASWTLGDWRTWGEAKRGSVGRAHPGCELRIADPGSGEPLPPGRVGLLEVRSAQLGPGTAWVRTADQASLDADGFLWIHGRADGAIVRGGFKVSPAEVERVLAGHPAVREAAVVGLPDPRLGQLPVAAVELHPGAPPVDGEALRRFARERLAPYQVPARVLVVASLPRTAALKVSQPDVRALFAP